MTELLNKLLIDLDDQLKFIDLSPFTNWILIVKHGNDIDPEIINEIEDGFEGTFLDQVKNYSLSGELYLS